MSRIDARTVAVAGVIGALSLGGAGGAQATLKKDPKGLKQDRGALTRPGCVAPQSKR
jgi:hypothetical protein